MKVHYLQHASFEGLGSIAPWLLARGHAISCTRSFDAEPLPRLDAFDALIVMGGPMSVGAVAQYPWLETERAFIRRAIDAGSRVLGVCLGSQLVAAALDARVSTGAQPEIGWFPLRVSPEAAKSAVGAALVDGLEVFHWHGDTFEIPAGAHRLASTEAFPNQGFVVDERVVALQFHLEATPATARGMIEHCGDELEAGPFVQQGDEMLARPERFDRTNSVMEALLAAWLMPA